LKIIREFSRMRRREEEDYIERRVGNHGLVVTEINAADLIDPLTGERSMPEMVGVRLSERVKIPLTKQDTLVAQAEAVTASGNGTGAITLDYEHIFSQHAHMNLCVTAGLDQSQISAQGWRQLSPVTQGFMRAVYPMTGHAAPTLEARMSRILSEKLTGIVTCHMGTGLTYRLGLRHNEEEQSWSTYVQAKRASVGLEAHGSKKLTKKLSVSAGANIWYDSRGVGASVTCMLKRQLSHLSKAQVGFVIGTDGIRMIISYNRFGQKFHFPILLSHVPNPVSVITGMLLPSVVAVLAKLLWLDPIQRLKESKKLERVRREREEYIRQQKEKAEQYRTLMEEKVAQKREEEEEKNGLVVVHAIYGKLPDKSQRDADAGGDIENNGLAIDVTVPLQFLVENSQCHLHPQSKSSLVGFYDPCPGETKHLEVIYLFRNKLHRVVINDLEPLRIPLQCA
jgi:DnaJ family protein C protein 11